MAVIVVGGSGRGVGKTSLVCGLISALPEIAFAAVKITTHEHGQQDPVWEDVACEKLASREPIGPGTGKDTARYLAAGARRALLVAASDDSFAARLGEVWAKLGPGANVIFESNRVAEFLQPDLCLGVETGGEEIPVKASFLPFLRRADALVARAAMDSAVQEPGVAKPLFRLADLEHVSPEMMAWVRSGLRS
jgi:hypothetical protein